MLKTLAILAIAAFATISVSCQPNKTADHKQPGGNQKNPSVSVPASAPDVKYASQANQPDPSNEPPVRDTPFKWPGWMSDSNWWLVIVALGTSIVIGWQAIETRKATAISQRALVLEYRPRVIVRTLKLTPLKADAGELADWQIEMVVANAGGTVAYIQPWSLRMEWYNSSRDKQIGEITQSPAAGFDLAGGQSRQIQATLTAEGFNISMLALTYSVQHRGKWQYRYPTVSGTISYRDDNKITRSTGFMRSWSVQEDRFCPSTDPEYEYQD